MAVFQTGTRLGEFDFAVFVVERHAGFGEGCGVITAAQFDIGKEHAVTAESTPEAQRFGQRWRAAGHGVRWRLLLGRSRRGVFLCVGVVFGLDLTMTGSHFFQVGGNIRVHIAGGPAKTAQ